MKAFPGLGALMVDIGKWWVLLVIVNILLAGTVVLLLDDDDEEVEWESDLPLNTDFVLWYDVSGRVGDRSLNGSFSALMSTYTAGERSLEMPLETRGDILGYSILPGLSFLGLYYDQTIIETAWGGKLVDIEVQAPNAATSIEGICIAYIGARSDIIYRLDLIGPDTRVTYELVDIDNIGIDSWDTRSGPDLTGMVHKQRRLEGDMTITMPGYLEWGVKEPGRDEAYHFNITSRGYDLLIFDEDDLRKMIGGGEFQYNKERSLFEDGAVEFTVDDEMVWYMAFEKGQWQDIQCRIEITVHGY